MCVCVCEINNIYIGQKNVFYIKRIKYIDENKDLWFKQENFKAIIYTNIFIL